MKKRISYIIMCVMLLFIIAVPTDDTHAANLSLSVSKSSADIGDKSSVNIGDTIKVEVSVPSGVTATIDIYFSNNLFEFVSADDNNVAVNGGTITAIVDKEVNVILKAKTTGTASISTSSIKAWNLEREEVELGGASQSVTIANQTSTETNTGSNGTTGSAGGNETSGTTKSSDNSLSSLKLSSGTLSPAFQYNVTNYTATVEYDVTKLVVSAKTANGKATIESVTGNGNVSLDVGKNTIQIVVKAENGVQATYTVVVTRKEKKAEETTSSSEKTNTTKDSQTEESHSKDSQIQEEVKTSETKEPEQESQVEETSFTYQGQNLNIIEKIPKEMIPTDFEKENLQIAGKEVPGMRFSKGELPVLYLTNETGEDALYIYDETEQTVYPFIKLISERNYVIVLCPNVETVLDGFTQCTLSIEGKGMVQAYRYAEEDTQVSGLFGKETYYAAEAAQSDFYLLYCVNSNGEYGWYQFDVVEGTFQRYIGAADLNVESIAVDTVSEQVDETETVIVKTQQKLMLGICGGIIFILLTIIVLLVISRKKWIEKYQNFYDNDEEEKNQEETLFDEAELSLSEVQTVSSFEEMIGSYESAELEEDISDEEVQEEVQMEKIEETNTKSLETAEEILEQATMEWKDEMEDVILDKTMVLGEVFRQNLEKELKATEKEKKTINQKQLATEIEFIDL